MKSKIEKQKHMQGLALVGTLLLSMAFALPAIAQSATDSASGEKKDSLGEIGAKLSDPTSDVWALFTEFDFSWSRGDLSDDDYKFGADMIFQPIMPFKLTKDWKLLTRPTIPIIFSTPIPTSIKPDGTARFSDKGGLADISMPLLFSPVPKPGQSYSVGFGPTVQFPTHTDSHLGTKTWEAGPALVATYKTKKITVGFLGQYWWSYSEYDGADDTSHGSFLPFFYYNLPKAWQVGFNPTMTYNDKATSDNQWNVPIGITVAKMTQVGNKPVKFQLGVEYAVERQDDFGPEWRIKLNVIPVVTSFQKNPFF
jgi:hypothetical protein